MELPLAIQSWHLGGLLSLALMSTSVTAISLEGQRAQLIPQKIQPRQEYQGGWAMGVSGVTCPADVPVKCTSSNIANTGCCPKGEKCFGLGGLYCCPTSTDCEDILVELPRCANETWAMYEYRTYYFCCPPGTFGVLPITNWWGICQPEGVQIPASRIAVEVTTGEGATATSIVGVGVSSRTTKLVTNTVTNSNGVIATVTESITTQATGTSTPNSGTEGSKDSTNESTPKSSSNSLGAGAIAGIVIGGLAVLAIFTLAFVLYKRNKRQYPTHPDVAPSYTAVPPAQPDMAHHQQHNYPIPVDKTPAVGAAHLNHGAVSPMNSQSGYGGGSGNFSPPQQNAHEVHGQNIPWEGGRAEMPGR